MDAGDEPFGSLLVGPGGKVLGEDRNRIAETGDPTQHPELNLARWAAANLSAEERADCTMYTSGEHCPMCAAANGWVCIGRIVYASSSRQLMEWLGESEAPAPPVRPLPVQEVASGIVVEGPALELAAQIRELHAAGVPETAARRDAP